MNPKKRSVANDARGPPSMPLTLTICASSTKRRAPTPDSLAPEDVAREGGPRTRNDRYQTLQRLVRRVHELVSWLESQVRDEATKPLVMRV
jgi:hypothetical protein